MTNEPEPNTRAGEALKPCPFCSGEMVVRDDFLKHSLEPSLCILAGAVFHIRQKYDWNTRAQLDAKDAMIDGQAALIATLTAERDKARADGDKLAGFTEHDSACPASWPEFIATDCTCGLTQALTEWKDRA